MTKVSTLIKEERYLEALWELANIIDHDRSCWRSIGARAARSSDEYTVIVAETRDESLREETALVYAAIEAMKLSDKG